MNGFLIPAIISRITSLADGTWRFYVDTQELEDFDFNQVAKNKGEYGLIYFTKGSSIPKEVLEELDAKAKGVLGKRSQSQKIRDSLWVYWTESGNGKEGFDEFYESQTNKMIERIQKSIENLKL